MLLHDSAAGDRLKSDDRQRDGPNTTDDQNHPMKTDDAYCRKPGDRTAPNALQTVGAKHPMLLDDQKK
jgi:hypothetical protein